MHRGVNDDSWDTVCMPRSVHPDQQELMDELESLRQRTIGKAFLCRGTTKPLTLRVVPLLIERRYRGLWENGKDSAKIEAIEEILLEAIDMLPEFILPDTQRGSKMTFRRAAAVMFDLVAFDDCTEARIQDYGKHRHDMLTRYIKDEAGFYASQDIFKTKVNKRIRQLIAGHLLSSEQRNYVTEPFEHIEGGATEAEKVEKISNDPETKTPSVAKDHRSASVSIGTVNGSVVTGDNAFLVQHFNYGDHDDQ